MLGKKQYGITLLAAVLVFFILFTVTYCYELNKNENVNSKLQPTKGVQNSPMVAFSKPEVCILPSTKITLRTFDQEKGLLDTISLNALSLLGFTEEKLASRFKDYTIETFNEDQVDLAKIVENTPNVEAKELDAHMGKYVLSVEGDAICIKLKGNQSTLIILNRKATDFSSYVYSLFLKEKITLTEAQKEMLIKDAGTLEKILQDYMGE